MPVFQPKVTLAAALSAVLILAASTVASAQGKSAARSMAGHWSYIVEQSCTRDAQNKKICYNLLGRLSSWSNWFDAKATANGKLTFTAGFVATQNDPKAKHVCNISVISKSFNGSCLVTDHGTGFIKKSKTGPPYIWIASESLTFHGAHETKASDPFGPYPSRNQAATPGVFGTGASLRQAGLLAPGQKVPAGIYWNTTVTHTK